MLQAAFDSVVRVEDDCALGWTSKQHYLASTTQVALTDEWLILEHKNDMALHLLGWIEAYRHMGVLKSYQEKPRPGTYQMFQTEEKVQLLDLDL